jgi:regulator of sirC expression with transglutaminase-like and TPR domain
LGDRQVDPSLELACALISSAGDPTFAVSEIVEKINKIADNCVATDVPGLMGELFSPRRFVGNSLVYDDPKNSLIGYVMDRKIGIPITLCVVAISVAKRKGLPVFGVGMPGHYLCGFTALNGSTTYFDPFHSARELTADDCRLLYEGMTGLGNWSDEFLLPASNRLTIIRILANLKSIYRRKGDLNGIRWVMRLRLAIPEIAAVESVEFARLVRASN